MLNKNTVLLLKIFDESDEFEHLLGDSWPVLREELIELILSLEAGNESMILRRRIDTFLGRFSLTPAEGRVKEIVKEIEKPEALLLKIFDVSEEFEHLLGDSWTDLQQELAALMLRLDNDDEFASLRRDIDAFVGRLSLTLAGDLVQKLVNELGIGRQTQRSGGIQKSPVPGETILIPVYYATNREEQLGKSVEERYTGERGTTLGFGVAHVSIPIPPTHKLGVTEGPRWWHLEFKPDPRRHVVLLDIDSMEREQYVAALKNAITYADSRDALVYVHGFNVTFAGAVRQTARIAYDLKFPGRTLLYSWPSKGKGGLLDYTADEATIEWSTHYFKEFLRMVLTEIGASTVHLIAHSMGNRALARAIEHLDTSTLPPGSATLRQIIFAAPDIDRDVFLQIATAFYNRSEHFTLYASDKDIALKCSKYIHQRLRAGEIGGMPVIASGVDTIDASNTNTSLFGLGHSYYADRRSILSDIYEILMRGTSPNQRFELLEQSSPLGTYWYCRP